RRRIGVIVRRNVNRLHRGDRAFFRRRDALLKLAHLRRERRLVPTAEGIRPRSAETSEPACVNRKMLSTKSSTSWPSSSRKYSAAVRADRATRARAPGG